jgi:TPM domain
MFLLRSTRSLFLCLAAAVVVHGQNELLPPGGPPPLPPAEKKEKPLEFPARPAGGLLDAGNVFTPEERIQVEADLEDFHARTGLTLHLVTQLYVHADSPDAWSRGLLRAWTQDGPALLVVYERGANGLHFQGSRGLMPREEDMRQLFRAGDRAAKSLPRESSAGERLRALLRSMTLAGEQWRQTGSLPDAGEPPPPAPPAAPAADSGPPAGGVLDGGNVIPDAEQAALEQELRTFRQKWDFDIIVVTATWLPDATSEQWAARLAREWLPQRHGLIIAYNRGTTGSSADQPLAVAVSRTGEEFLGLIPAHRLRTLAPEVLRAEEARERTAGLPAAIRFVQEQVSSRAAELGKVAMQSTGRSGRSPVFMALAGALVLGSALMYLFHRLQERLERRSGTKFHFPQVKVAIRLGAPHGGGVVAGGRCGKKPDARGSP